MIDENFLQSAVRIRRTYLKMSNSMDFYKKSAQGVVERLDETIKKVEAIQKEAEDSKRDKNSNFSAEGSMNKMLKVLEEVDNEGKRLEGLVDPLNKEIEKLALEEQELYRLIKEKHYNLTDDEIIESVKQRLLKENLS
jgi:predicted RNase H-like nuclease (RuvC/YqgF family)